MFNQQVQKLLTLLCEKYPLTFFMYHGRRKPLKVGIGHDLNAALGDVDRKLISNALRNYVSNKGYLRAVIVGVARIDLDGNQSGFVSEDEAKNARARIAGFRRPKPKPPVPKRDGLASLREAARKRRQASGASGGGA